MDKNKKAHVPWLPKILPILFCLVLVLIIYYPVFLKRYWAVNRSDALNIHLPNNNIIADAFRHRQVPLWNPNVNLGQPTIDGFSLIFHPALVLYLFFTPWLANTIEILLGLALSFLGTWFLLRQQGLEVFPAAVGTVLYVLCGPVFFLHSYHLDFMAILLLPWMLWVFHQHDRTKHIRMLWTAATLCVIAVQSIESDTLFYLYIGLIIDRLVCLPKHQRRTYVIKWLGIFLLSGLTGLLRYLPLHEWIVHSSRMNKSYVGVLTPGLPNILTAILTNQWLIRWPYDSFYFYFGPALIWLILAGLVKFNKADYPFRYFLYSLVIPAFYILKRLLQLYHLTFLSSFEAWRSMFVFSLSLSMVAAIGVRNILQGQRLQRWWAWLAGLLTLTLAVWTIYCGTYVVIKYTVLLIAAGGMLIAALRYSKRSNIFRIAGISVAVGVTFITSAVLYTTERRFCVISSKSGYIKRLSFYRALVDIPDLKQGHGRISTFGMVDNTTSLAGLKTIPNYTCVYNNDMEDTLCADGLIVRSNRLPYWMELDNPDAYALSFYGVQFLVTLEDFLRENNSIGWIKRPDLSWFLYSVWENKYYFGRAYLVTRLGQRHSGGEFLEDTPVSVAIRAEAEEGESLVLADLNYPGWQAQVDGKNVPTEVYHGCLRSVKLSKGTHIVQWRYNGRIQRIGMILSLIALSFLVVFLIIPSILKRKANIDIRGQQDN